jgi:hypothetical protein
MKPVACEAILMAHSQNSGGILVPYDFNFRAVDTEAGTYLAKYPGQLLSC